MTLPLPWTVNNLQTGELADTQTAYRMLMPLEQLARAGLLAFDTFTRPDAASLGTAESGQTWDPQAGTFSVSAQQASSTTSSQAVLDVGRPDVDVWCAITPQSGAPGVVVRGGTAASGTTGNSRLSVQLDMGAGFRLNKTEIGVGATLQTATRTFTAGAEYLVRVVVIADRLLGYLWGPDVDGDNPLLLDYTLSAGEMTTLGALTRVGLRNTGSATFDDFVVRVASPAVSGGGAETLETLPGRLVVSALESAGTYVRPTARTDVVCMFIGTANPGATALENDIWVKLP